jgi:molecular chaperone GrpE
MTDKDKSSKNTHENRTENQSDAEPLRFGDDAAHLDTTSPGFSAEALVGEGATAVKLEAELLEAKKNHLYLAAEFENYKKNVIKERSDLRKFGAERLVVDLLNIVDIFETALGAELTADTIENFRKGIELTSTEMKSTLARHGVTEVPALGAAFDPNLHEALTSEESETVPEGHIVRVFKKPYKLHDRLIRPAQVVVAKAKASTT